MPIWLILLLATGPAFGLIYCLAMWDAKRDCRACRIAFFLAGEIVGGGLLINGWKAGSELQVALGTATLLILNLYLGLRALVRHLGSKQARNEILPKNKSPNATATGAAAVAAAQTLSPASKESEHDEDPLSAVEGGDLDLDL